MPINSDPTQYTGRFAPSPSGPLHFGSLLAALASFADARHRAGRWLVRMEDLDPPREMPGADRLILTTLEQHALHWDGDVLYQSSRHTRYRDVLSDLQMRGRAYRCACSRARLLTLDHVYDGHCRTHSPAPDQPCAIRLQLPDETVQFADRIQGLQQQNLALGGDCIIHRKDGFFAYQLAVVVDDIDQGVTDVVRGSDILESTGRQIYLTRLLGAKDLGYAHIPVALGADGQKLSKQNHAPTLDDSRPSRNLHQALNALGQNPPVELASEMPEVIVEWAVTHWNVAAIPEVKAFIA
ncbi:MAG TPA: tRNA glutamyl-Q(34) synthetase GluQRS [Pseudomonadales bacterium]|nr:tRNA glutamyl-Q(34) synthetase GluQRS [Pseudomonadales bacterium]